MGVRAKCSRCDYLRTFAEELRGTYYRCPKCREGVIAVPEEAREAAPSDEAPAVRAARMRDGRSSEAVARESSGARPALEAEDGKEASEDAEALPNDETPRGAFFGAAQAPGPRDDAAHGPVAGKKRPVKVKRILVECALCGYHVAVPPELFGKTVHCPECRADMTFSESSLEPVKDEIISRIAMDHAERRVLDHAVTGPIASPDAVLRSRRRWLVLYVLLFVVVAGVAALIARLAGM